MGRGKAFFQITFCYKQMVVKERRTNMVYKKQVNNTTDWSTDELIEIIERCAEHRGINLEERLTRNPSKGDKPLRIKRAPRTNVFYRGRCYAMNIDGNPKTYQAGEIYLGVPPVKHRWGTKEGEKREFNKEKFAQVALHEMDHLLGLTHKEMMSSSNLSTPDLEDVKVETDL